MKKLLAALALALLVFSQAGAAHATTWQGSGSWAGAEDNGPVTRVSGDFIIPAVTSQCGATSRAAVWVGLGGDGTYVLSQVGFTLTPSGAGAWYEVIDANNGGFEQDVNFPVKTGDHVRLALAFYTNRTVLHVRWTDVTTGATLLASVPNAGRYYSSRTADWIVEQQDGHNLAHFGAVKWAAAWRGMETTAVNVQPATYQVDMTDGITPWATTSFPTDKQSVTVTWKRC